VDEANCQRMKSLTDKMSASNSRAAYIREYRKRKRLEEDNCNNVPKRTELHGERYREYRETHENLPAEYLHFTENAIRKEKLRKVKHHKHLRQLTLQQLL
jgi:hypothetical protein